MHVALPSGADHGKELCSKAGGHGTDFLLGNQELCCVTSFIELCSNLG